MLVRPLALVALAVVAGGLVAPAAQAQQDCSFVMENLMGANSACSGGHQSSCAAVDALIPMAVDACGSKTVARSGVLPRSNGTGLLDSGPSKDQIRREELAKKAREWEGKHCAYFTKDHVERDSSFGVRSVRMNSYQVGDHVCHQEMLFSCRAGQVWDYRGACDDYGPTYKRSEQE